MMNYVFKMMNFAFKMMISRRYFTSADDHTPHENWNMDVVRVNRDIAYSKTKVDTEEYCYAAAGEANDRRSPHWTLH